MLSFSTNSFTFVTSSYMSCLLKKSRSTGLSKVNWKTHQSSLLQLLHISIQGVSSDFILQLPACSVCACSVTVTGISSWLRCVECVHTYEELTGITSHLFFSINQPVFFPVFLHFNRRFVMIRSSLLATLTGQTFAKDSLVGTYTAAITCLHPHIMKMNVILRL